MPLQTQFEVSTANEVVGTIVSSSESSIESRTIRKLQIRLLPFLFLLYVVAFIDRINIGFAALTMNKEMAITSQQFGFAAGIFFFGYFLFEVPSNLLLHKIGARIWITRILITWGILATLTGFVHTVHQLYVVRFLLGLAEAGYFPGIVLYLTYWFRQREQAQAVALFLTGLPVTSIIGAPISGLILDHAHWLGLSSWRWLLVLEGLPAIVCGLLTYFWLPNRPAEAKFLTPEEQEWIQAGLLREEHEKLPLLRFPNHGERPRVASRRHRIRGVHRPLHPELLGAPVAQVSLRPTLEWRGRSSDHDSAPGGYSGHGPRVAQLGPPVGTALPCRNTDPCWRSRSAADGHLSFSAFPGGAFVPPGSWRLQLCGSLLGSAWRISNRIFSGRWHRAY